MMLRGGQVNVVALRQLQEDPGSKSDVDEPQSYFLGRFPVFAEIYGIFLVKFIQFIPKAGFRKADTESFSDLLVPLDIYI